MERNNTNESQNNTISKVCQLKRPHQIIFGLGHIGVISSQFGLIDFQSSRVVVLHLIVLSLVLTQQGQVVQLLGYIWVVLAQHLQTAGKNISNNIGTHL